MKTNLYSLARLLLIIAISFQSCNNPESEMTPGPRQGTPTQVGKAIGAPTTKLIGVSGGSIGTADGKLTLTIPPGALEKETAIKIQPVENKAINGIGIGYEFTPDGTRFNKPITFSYHYTADELTGATTGAMGLATQNADGIWVAERIVKVDPSTMTITGKLDHFSWWSIFAAYTMTPEEAVVGPGTWIDLKITEAIDAQTFPSTSDDSDLKLLAPLTETLISPSLMKKISLNGNGNLTQISNPSYPEGSVSFDAKAKGAVIRYSAPVTIHEKNPVSIAVELGLASKAQFILISNIRVQNENSFIIQGKEFTNIQSTATISNGKFILSMLDRDNPVEMGNIFLITTLTGEGSVSFDPEKTDLTAAMKGGKVQGQSAYRDKCTGIQPNFGIITIKKIFQNNGQRFVEGSIRGTCTQSYYNSQTSCAVIEHKTFEVSATFKIPLQ